MPSTVLNPLFHWILIGGLRQALVTSQLPYEENKAQRGGEPAWATWLANKELTWGSKPPHSEAHILYQEEALSPLCVS